MKRMLWTDSFGEIATSSMDSWFEKNNNGHNLPVQLNFHMQTVHVNTKIDQIFYEVTQTNDCIYSINLDIIFHRFHNCLDVNCDKNTDYHTFTVFVSSTHLGQSRTALLAGGCIVFLKQDTKQYTLQANFNWN